MFVYFLVFESERAGPGAHQYAYVCAFADSAGVARQLAQSRLCRDGADALRLASIANVSGLQDSLLPFQQALLHASRLKRPRLTVRYRTSLCV